MIYSPFNHGGDGEVVEAIKLNDEVSFFAGIGRAADEEEDESYSAAEQLRELATAMHVLECSGRIKSDAQSAIRFCEKKFRVGKAGL